MQMGIEKVAGKYIDEMTEPNRWPHIDESHLQTRAMQFLETRNLVDGVAFG